MTSSMQEMIGWAVKIWRAESNAHLRVALSNSWGVVCSSRHLGSLFWCKWLVTLYTPWSWYNIVKQQLVVPPPCTPDDMCCAMSISVSGVTKASNLSSIGLVASKPLGKLFSLQSLAMFVNNRRTSVLSANTLILWFIAFLQQCALRSQDFAIYHREYIEFENPDECGSAFSRLGTENLMSVQCNFPRAENFLTAVKTL